MNDYEIIYNGSISLRKSSGYEFSFLTPSMASNNFNFSDKIAAIIHVYYTDLLDDLLNAINNINSQVDLFISTDTFEKEIEIKRLINNYIKGETEIRVLQNRGRDIAPMIIGFKDVFSKYKYFLHLHTKKSLHLNNGSNGWLNYALSNLLGSKEIANFNLWLLSHKDIGIVFPLHNYHEINRINISHGFNFDNVKNLLKKCGIDIDIGNYCEFPSGSMFFGRTDAIKPLIEIGLDWEDFSPEMGQTDLTLAHAIERSILYICEKSNYKWAKIATYDPKYEKELINICSENDYKQNIEKIFISVLEKRYDLVTKLVSKDCIELSATKVELSATKVELNNILNSNSWKITKLMRFAGKFVRNIKHLKLS
ncbi:MAG: rhamnan synthesis F family protein [Burkholderiales bacterium]|nr:rhamnan synthesis F family protein [Burkholderiales bacterium]